MQKFQVPANLAAQIETLNAKIGEESPERLIEIRPEFRPLGHNGRVLNVPVYDVIAEGSGKFSLTAQAAKNTLLPVINEQIVSAARQAIERQIAAENEARQNEAARFESQIAEERRRAKEAADMAAIAADEQRQKILKEAAQKQAALEAQLKAIADAKASRYNKASRAMAGFAMFILFLVCVITAQMNVHNVVILFNKMIPTVILWFFAYVLGFIPAIFAWVKDNGKVKQMTWILFIDYLGTIVLYIVLSNMSPLAANWEWLANNQIFVHLFFSLLGGVFYAYQAKQTYVKLLEIMSKVEYKEFFMSLFD